MIGKTLQEQIDLAYKELECLNEHAEPGTTAWRLLRRYIDGLEFAKEELRLDERLVKATEDIADRLERHEELMKQLIRAVDSSMVF